MSSQIHDVVSKVRLDTAGGVMKNICSCWNWSISLSRRGSYKATVTVLSGPEHSGTVMLFMREVYSFDVAICSYMYFHRSNVEFLSLCTFLLFTSGKHHARSCTVTQKSQPPASS